MTTTIKKKGRKEEKKKRKKAIFRLFTDSIVRMTSRATRQQLFPRHFDGLVYFLNNASRGSIYKRRLFLFNGRAISRYRAAAKKLSRSSLITRLGNNSPDQEALGDSGSRKRTLSVMCHFALRPRKMIIN